MEIKLEMKTMLPKIRAAYDAGELQMQKETLSSGNCSYHGPCAIGVCMTPKERIVAEPHHGFSSDLGVLIRDNLVVIVNQSELDDIETFQTLHDAVVATRYNWSDNSELIEAAKTDFLRYLVYMEEIYLNDIPASSS